MNIVVQHLKTRLYLAKNGSWVKLNTQPATFENAVQAISLCIQRALRSVRLVSNYDSPGKERFFYPFGEDPAVKAEKKRLRRQFAESRRLERQRRMLCNSIDLLRAESKERKRQIPFKRKKVGED